MEIDLETVCIPDGSTLLDAISKLDVSKTGIVFVVGEGRTLLGTVTDGDIRRAAISGVDFDQDVSTILRTKGSPAVTAPEDSDAAALLKTLRQHKIRQLPLIDSVGRVTGMVILEEFIQEQTIPLKAVVMAGGMGARLSPLTDEVPKPMLPVGDRPLMEHIIEQLRSSGITQVNLAVHHMSERITEHFGDGHQFGVQIGYVTEDRPLGTAGALGLIDTPSDTLLVVNGDILTQINYKEMLAYHRENHAVLTMAVQRHDIRVPYGVVECRGTMVQTISEKPVLKNLINAGIYLLEPEVYRYIPSGQPYDMTELIQSLITDKMPIAAFPIHEYWRDIGGHDDYAQAQEDVKSKESNK